MMDTTDFDLIAKELFAFLYLGVLNESTIPLVYQVAPDHILKRQLRSVERMSLRSVLRWRCVPTPLRKVRGSLRREVF